MRKRLLTDFASVDFGVLLSRFSVCFWGVISTKCILPPKNKPKIGQNNPQNRRSRNPLTVSKIVLFFSLSLLCLIIAIALIWTNRENILAHFISRQMHVPVTIGSLALNKTSAEVSEFWVGNFPRSLSSTSFTAQSLQIHAGLQQIFSNPVVIDEIDIDNIFVGIEFYNAEGTDSNWTRILNEKEPKKKSSRDYLIRTLMLRNLTVEVRQADGSIKTYPTIQQMEFHNISKDTGFPVDEIEKAIFDLMMKNLFKNLPIDKLFKVLKPLPLPFLGTDS